MKNIAVKLELEQKKLDQKWSNFCPPVSRLSLTIQTSKFTLMRENWHNPRIMALLQRWGLPLVNTNVYFRHFILHQPWSKPPLQLFACCGSTRDDREANPENRSGIITSCGGAHSTVNFPVFSRSCVGMTVTSSAPRGRLGPSSMTC